MKFWKYSGAGNDFILFHGAGSCTLDNKLIQKLCDRKFGVGADGVLWINTEIKDHDFKMTYFNADGGEVEMCGNGARACVHWYCSRFNKKDTAFITNHAETYQGKLLADQLASVTMNTYRDADAIKVSDLIEAKESFYVNTGVPHAVFMLDDKQDIQSNDWMKLAPVARADSRFTKGCNINFAKLMAPASVIVRTYERGVEAETLACGTGAVAVARFLNQKHGWNKIKIKVAGGDLEATFDESDCWLAGPIVQVFNGEVDI
ncbi:MAG: diaminopimelate epimerase [Halobacteriovorax sp.]|nr:diaminopimelate epimerase [Halobacteriovorax sp.]